MVPDCALPNNPPELVVTPEAISTSEQETESEDYKEVGSGWEEYRGLWEDTTAAIRAEMLANALNCGSRA